MMTDKVVMIECELLPIANTEDAVRIAEQVSALYCRGRCGYFRDSVKRDLKIMCLTGETEVLMSNGSRTISSIVDEQITTEVLTSGGQWNPIEQHYKRPYKGELIQIIVQKINIPMNITPNHEVFVWDTKARTQRNWYRGQLSIKKAGDLKAGNLASKSDKLVIPLPIEHDRESVDVPPPIKWARNLIPEGRFRLTKENLRLLGLYVAEGHVSKTKVSLHNSTNVTWSFGSNENKLIGEVKETLKNSFNIEASTQVNTATQITASSAQLGHFILSNFNTGSRKKKLPVWLLELPKEKLQHFMSGAVDGDGHKAVMQNSWSNEPVTTYASASKTLIMQLFLVAIKLGVIPSLRMYHQRNHHLNGREIKSSTDGYYYNISWRKSGKGTVGQIINNFLILPIKRIKQIPFSGYVYNIGIKQDHSYTANLFAVKNCFSPQDAYLAVLKEEIRKRGAVSIVPQ